MGEGENIKECISDVGEGVFLLAGINSAIGAVGNLLVVVVGEPTVEVCVDCIDCILFVLNNPTFTKYAKYMSMAK